MKRLFRIKFRSHEDLLDSNARRMLIFSYASAVIGILTFAYLAYTDQPIRTHSLVNTCGMSLTAFMWAYILRRIHGTFVVQGAVLRGEVWLRDLYEIRTKDLKRQEAYMAENVRRLKADFEEEKKLLQEIREERESELQALGYVKELKDRPDVQRFLDDPRHGMRIVSTESGGGNAGTEKAS